MQETADDHITLVVPATTPYARIARIGAATIALRRGFSFQEIHDLRLAMDEALILLLGDHERGGTIEVDFRVTVDRVAIDAAARFDDAPGLTDGGLERFASLVGGLVDDYHIDRDSGRVRLTKTRS